MSAQDTATFSPSIAGSPSISRDAGGPGQSASPNATGGGASATSRDISEDDQEQIVRPGSAPASESDASAPLSASRIFAVLQQNPDAVIELKSLMADVSQQQGTPIQADSITDQMLYSKIASSQELRTNVTTFLRARGYTVGDGPESYSDGDNSDIGGVPPELAVGRDLNLNSNAPFYEAGPDSTGAMGTRQYNSGRSTPATHKRAVNDATSEPQALHQPAPYNMLALRDLYTQLPEQNGRLKRFGSDVFFTHGGYPQASGALAGRGAPLDIPASPDYVVGPGDALTISLWGGISQSLTRTIDRDGKIDLPEAGPVQVAGLTLERVRGVITDALKHQYRDAQVAITVGRLRSIRVYVVGDVQRPGAFDISSLSTSLASLVAAGGPTSIGSLRVLRHYRGQHLVGEVDLYDFLLHGVQSEDRLQSGDTLIVPPSGPQVAVYGAVKRPAIYELKGETTLAAVLQDAGGVTVSAELGHIVIDRIDANRERRTVSLNLPSTRNA
ncbi:MAG: polysaccharide biosynthesis/export family protein, partial [Acidobacteriaceae bacterium]